MAELIASNVARIALGDPLHGFAEQLIASSKSQPGPTKQLASQGQPASRATLSHPNALVEPLTPQEQRVLRLLGAGLSNPEIAGELVVSVNTIKTHLQSIYRKLGVNSRREARSLARGPLPQ